MTRRRWSGTRLPPGPATPASLQALQWGFAPVAYLLAARRRFGETFTMRIGRAPPIVSFSHPDAISAIFRDDGTRLHGGEANRVIEPVFGRRSLLLLDDDEHRRHRKLVLPPFHGARLASYEDDMREIANARIDGWRAGDSFPALAEAQAITLGVILRVVFGIRDVERREVFRERLAALNPNLFRAFVFLSDRLPTLGSRDPRMAFARARQALHDLVHGEISERRRSGRESQNGDVVGMLLQAHTEDGRPLSDDELCDELITLVISGHESTAFSLSWTFELLFRHATVLERAEAEAMTPGSDYLDAVIKESLRIRPVLPLAVRRVVSPATIGGVELPAGVTVAANIFLAHLRAEAYGDPFAFRPERFLGPSPPSRHSWLPFGGGIRRCVGASFSLVEMRVILEAILARATLRSLERGTAKVSKRGFSFAPRGDVPVVVERVARRDELRAPVSTEPVST